MKILCRYSNNWVKNHYPSKGTYLQIYLPESVVNLVKDSAFNVESKVVLPVGSDIVSGLLDESLVPTLVV